MRKPFFLLLDLFLLQKITIHYKRNFYLSYLSCRACNRRSSPARICQCPPLHPQLCRPLPSPNSAIWPALPPPSSFSSKDSSRISRLSNGLSSRFLGWRYEPLIRLHSFDTGILDIWKRIGKNPFLLHTTFQAAKLRSWEPVRLSIYFIDMIRQISFIETSSMLDLLSMRISLNNDGSWFDFQSRWNW